MISCCSLLARFPSSVSLSLGALDSIRRGNINQRNKMKKQIGLLTLVVALCGVVPLQAADVPAVSEAKINRDQAQQLLKERDEARPKAEAAEKKMRDAGAGPRVDALGFASAKSLRDQQAASESKARAYDRYARTAKQIEKRIQDEVYRGLQPPLAADIARFERLQAEVDLARIAGLLPAEEK